MPTLAQGKSLTIQEYNKLPGFALSIRNISDTTSIKMGIRNPSFIKLYSNQIIIDELMLENMPEEERALTIWHFIKERRWHCHPISPNSLDLHDPVKLINVFGCGYCDDAAAVMTNLSIKAGLKSRIWNLNGHVVSEVFYNSAWHMFDTNQKIMYQDSLQNVLSVEFLECEPDFIMRYSKRPLIISRKEYAEIICSIDDNEISEWYLNKDSVHSMFFLLNPDDEVQFHFKEKENNNASYEEMYPTTGKLFRYLKNSKKTRYDNGQLIYSESFAYAIDSIIIKLKNRIGFNKDPVKVAYSADNENWIEIGEMNGSSETIYFKPHNGTGEKFTFNYFIRFSTSNSSDASNKLTRFISNISIENRFMFSYLSLINVHEKDLNLTLENINGEIEDIKFNVLMKEK